MGVYIGEFNTSSRVDDCFTLVTTDGTPTAVTSGSLVCRRLGQAVLAPAGVTAITTSGGLHTFSIFTASATSYFLAGYDYTTYFGNGTITTTTVIGYVVNTFSILNRVSNVVQVNGSTAIFQSAADVADAVWDEARSGHASTGTYGEAVTGVINTTSANVKEILGVASAGVAGYMGLSWATTTGTAMVNADVRKSLGTAWAGTAGYAGLDWSNTTGTTFVKATGTFVGDWSTFTGTATVNANIQNVQGIGSKGTAGYLGTDWANTTGTAMVNADVRKSLGTAWAATAGYSALDWAATTGTATINANVQNIKGVGSKGTAGYVGIDWANTTGTAQVNTAVSSLDWTAFTGTATLNANVQNVKGQGINALIAGRIDANTQVIANAAIGSATFATNAIDAAALAADGANEYADAFLARDIAGGASTTDRDVSNTLKAIRNKTVITTTGQLIVYEADDTTTAWTAVTTTVAAVSISSVDPA